MDEFLVLLQAKLDEAKSKGNVNADIEKLQSQLNKLKVQVEIDPKATQKLADDIGKLINQKITISNIGIDTKAGIKAGQEYGKQVSQGISQGISSASKSTEKVLRDFSELNDAKRKFVDGHDLISKDDIADAERLYDTVRKAFSEFGQVTVSKGSMNDGLLENMRVKIEQVNGEMKITRDFMLYFNESRNGFKLVDDDTIRTTEKMIQHLNEEKNIINATNEEANAIKEKLAEQEKYYGKLGQATKEQIALEKQRITAGEKQLEILEEQSKRRDSRISYNEYQIDKKGLSDVSRQRKINDLEYSGREKIDIAFGRELDKSLTSLSKLKETWQEQGIYVDEFKAKVESLEKSLNEITIGDVKGLNTFKEQITSLSSEAKELSKIHEIQLSMDTGETESKIGALISRTNQWTDTNGNARISTQSLTDALDKLGIASNEYLKIPTEEKQKSLIEANEQLSIEYKKVASEVRSMNAEFAKDSAIDSLRQQYQTFYSENGKAHKQFGSQLKSAMSELAHGAEVPKQRVAELKRELLDTKNVCKELGLTGQTWFQNLGDKIKQLSTYLSGTVIIGKLLQSGKQIVDNVLKVDVSLVELEKVSDLTADGLEKVTDRAFELGKSLAKTGTDVLDAVTTFKRAGYDIEESMNYAEQALKTTNISENIQDAGQAADSLVNIMKGFQNESPEFAKKINDAVNQVSNTEDVDFDNLIDGATRLSAVADQSGMSFEQMLGTLTGGYEILGNMEKVATGQITIFSRLQAIQLDGEEEVSTVAKLQETFNNATKGAVNIADQTTGQLRNVYDILDDVANVWDELDKNTREALAIEAAGIRQKNVFLAMMQNWEGVKDAVESASDSVGSADVENEKYIKSIQGRVENFERSVQQLSRTVLDSDIIKWFVDLGTTGVNAIDKIVNTFGSLGTIGLGAGLFKIFKNVDYLKTPVCPLYI
jgi:TP901 family phage tail tape measure protein